MAKIGTTTTRNLTFSSNVDGAQTGQAASISGTSASHGYDQANRMTAYGSGAASASYGYDGAGLRASKTAGTASAQTWVVAEVIGVIEKWLSSLETYAASGFLFFPVDGLDLSARAIEARTGTSLPVSVEEFYRAYGLAGGDLWQALLASAAAINPGSDVSLSAAAPLRALAQQAEHVALVWDQRFAWRSPERWGYLCSIRPGHPLSAANNILFHLPATASEIRAAEQVVGMPLSPSYKNLLRITNGLGIGVQDLACVSGAGPQRADWELVLQGDWLHVDHAHEISAVSRVFYGVYDDDGGLDEVARILLGRKVIIPFAQTYERWCFDRSAPSTDGEYPILMWDHELCRARYLYTTFADWLQREFVPYIFDE